MDTILKINTQSLDDKLVKTLHEKYGNAALEIKVIGTHEQDWMNDNLFWELMELLDWEAESDDKIIEPLVVELSNLPVQYIYGFQDILAEKLFDLDTKIIASHFINDLEILSADDFLYARCCVVANGMEAFFSVIENPELMPDVTFEPLLEIASKAYKIKTGNDFDYIPAKNFETHSNKEAWL
jgi:hypothetical protein